jgi:hypothetical protein
MAGALGWGYDAMIEITDEQLEAVGIAEYGKRAPLRP